MANLFYNIVSIGIRIILICFGSINLRKNRISFTILTYIHSLLFLTAGIGGFFLPQQYQYITILAMLAFCITMAISLLTLKKKPKEKKAESNQKTLK